MRLHREACLKWMDEWRSKCFCSLNNLKVGASRSQAVKLLLITTPYYTPPFHSHSADDNVAFTLPTGSNPPPPPHLPLPPIMSCFPTVGEQDRNGCKSAKTEMREGGREGGERTRRWRRRRDGRERRQVQREAD